MAPVPAWLDELTFTAADGSPWLEMGLRRCRPEAWLIVDEHRQAELRDRAGLLAERHPEVFWAEPGREGTGAEVLELVRSWLATHQPELLLPATAAADPSAHPLEAAGRLVQEDLVVVSDDGGSPRLVAACLCSPSHWVLAAKSGRPVDEIHAPVPGYRRELGHRVDRYLSAIRPGTISRRRNWGLQEGTERFEPVRPPPTVVAPDEVPDRLWLRSERQTLRRLAVSGAVLFTIRVQMAPMGALASRPALAAGLAARLRHEPEDLIAYRGLEPYVPSLVEWLDRVAQGVGRPR